MITGELKSKIDRLWDAFWSGGISNPLEVIEQITYLLFIKRLDDLHTLEEKKAIRTGEPMERHIFPESCDDQGCKYDDLRWSRFAHAAPSEMFKIVSERVFPFLRTLGGDESTYSHHMKDARFTIPNPALLSRVVDMLDGLRMDDRDTMGELYEYALSKIATAGHNGQFRTPQHIIQSVVEMMAPTPTDEICDPACGTAGFLVEAGEYVRRTHPDALSDTVQQKHFHEGMFHGFDFDNTMLRIGSMNMLLHGVENPDIRYRDSLAENVSESEKYSLVMANPPFAGSIDTDSTSRDLQRLVKTKKIELLFVALTIRLLKPGGRAAVIVPDGVLFGSSKAHKEIRRILVEEHRLDGVVKLPKGTFTHHLGVPAAILLFTKTNSGGTDLVWFYEVTADGWSLDGKQTPLLSWDKLGPTPITKLTATEHDMSNLPDLVARWKERDNSERKRNRTDQSFLVEKHNIVANDYDLSLQRYRESREQQRLLEEKALRLGDFAEVFKGWVPASDLDRTERQEAVPKEVRVLHPSLLTAVLPEVGQLPVRKTGREPKRRLSSGDIVGRDLGESRHWTVLPETYEGVQAGQGLVVIRPTGHAFPPEYLVEYLSSNQAESQFPRYDVVPRIRSGGLADILIPPCDGSHISITSAMLKVKEGVKEARQILSMLDESRVKVFDNCTSSERRLRLDAAAELSALTAQNLRKQKHPYQAFQDAYPYAIARAVRRFRHSSSLQERHESAIQCVESLILSLGIVSLSLAADRGWQDLSEVTSWSESVERGGVSLGHWLGVIRAAGNFARKGGDEAAGLAQATATQKGGKGLISDLESLVSLRNKVRHGAGPRTQAEIEKSLNNIEQLMFRGLSASSFLAKAKWVYPTRLSWVPESDKFRVSALAIMGDHPDFEPLEFDASQPVGDHRLYVVSENGDRFPLAPFCVLEDCPSCLTPELYYPDRLSRSTALLKSLDRGHELESTEVFAALYSWMNP
ncbi:type I restriction-modification system subunit M [Micromonospora sp. DT53]|uniref:type I restriction-modification system subunit M n=1 Tax=Micromonospora sp. DT53 TaxID=3393444 RepID=UPI003CEDBF46